MFRPLGDDKASYGRLFERGAVVSLVGDDHTPILKGTGISPAIHPKARNMPYSAFSSESTWKYTSKKAFPDAIPSLPYDPNPLVTSWINKLPTPGQMLPHGDDADIVYPDSGISTDDSKKDNGNSGERDLDQEQIDEQRRKLLPLYISQLVPTLPENVKPSQQQENAHEQQNRAPRQIGQTLPILSDSGQEIAQEMNNSYGNHGTTSSGGRGNIEKIRGVDGRQNNFQTDQRGRGSRGNRGHSNRGRGNRGNYGNRGNRGNRGGRGGRGYRGGRGGHGLHDAQGPTLKRQPPPKEPSMGSNGAACHIPDLTPSHFTEIPQQGCQGQVDNSTIVSDPTSSGWIPPHMRYKARGSQTSATTQTSEGATEARGGRSIDVDPDESDHEQRLKQLQAGIDEMMDTTKSETAETQPLPAQPPAMPVDPFAETWNMHRLRRNLPRTRSGNSAHRVQNDGAQARDTQDKTAHSTMKQQASARPTRGNAVVPRDSALELVAAMSQKIARMMSSLEVYPGNVSLKAEIGRFCITKFSPVYVQNQGKGEPLQNIKEVLDKHHPCHGDLMSTNILTAEGSDANYMALRTDKLGNRVWCSNNRRTVYQIFCCAATKNNTECYFVIEVDGSDFTYQVRPFLVEPCAIFVHCPKRSWDFKVTINKYEDLGEDFDKFAQDVIRSMWIE
ncbi:hypothetical protein F5B19DRAFT_174054 [Rostrohypoxylon terebratum]|nr:hypothetical protein F5B19DRAFT_174054 [Rostrohypoxylon terebratum]